MKLFFYGAAREVTGSCYQLEINNKKFLVDCGLQQGQDEKDNQNLPFDAPGIDFVILTHAHIDHSGRLPLLVKEGFRGKIYAIGATNELLSIMLRDSANIQEMDAIEKNKKYKRTGRNKFLPLYTMADAENTLKYLIPCRYNEITDITEGVKIRFVDAGHILGSASLELFLTEGAYSKKIVFSGDIGNTDQPIVRDPECISSSDYVVMEATYGDRNHDRSIDYVHELAKIIDKTLTEGGNVIIPAFAVGRTQGLLYLVREMKEKRLFANSDFKVYVDSPLATEATKLYDMDLKVYGDSQTTGLLDKGLDPLSFPGLSFTDSVEESKALNYDPVPKVIISSSGMCEGGRIRHHLMHNLPRKESSIILVGFQANGTLGKALLEGAKTVMLFGEEVRVLASIHNFTGLSAHADMEGLLKWINYFGKKPEKVFVTHVEESVIDNFIGLLTDRGFSAIAPEFNSVFDLVKNNFIDYS
jgi:metallo-beta-lactamase family protein